MSVVTIQRERERERERERLALTKTYTCVHGSIYLSFVLNIVRIVYIYSIVYNYYEL
jgi:hypothetical protein